MNQLQKRITKSINNLIFNEVEVTSLSSIIHSKFFWGKAGNMILKFFINRKETRIHRGSKMIANFHLGMIHNEIIANVSKIKDLCFSEEFHKESVFLQKHKEKRKRKLRLKSSDRIAVLTPPDSKALSDFKALTRRNKSQYTVFEISFSKKEQYLTLLKIIETQFDVICIIRGGGPAHQLLDTGNFLPLCQFVYSSKTKLLIALGHASDHSILEKMTPYRFYTPSSLALAILKATKSNTPKQYQNIFLKSSCKLIYLIANFFLSKGLKKRLKQFTNKLKYGHND